MTIFHTTVNSCINDKQKKCSMPKSESPIDEATIIDDYESSKENQLLDFFSFSSLIWSQSLWSKYGPLALKSRKNRT